MYPTPSTQKKERPHVILKYLSIVSHARVTTHTLWMSLIVIEQMIQLEVNKIGDPKKEIGAQNMTEHIM